MKPKETKRYGLVMATVTLWAWWFFDPRISSDATFIYELSLVAPLTATFFLLRDIYLRGLFSEPVPSTHLLEDSSSKKIITLIVIGVIIYCIYTIYMYRDQISWLFG